MGVLGTLPPGPGYPPWVGPGYPPWVLGTPPGSWVGGVPDRGILGRGGSQNDPWFWGTLGVGGGPKTGVWGVGG